MKRKLILTLLAIALLADLPSAAQADDVTTADVKGAIDRGIAHLRERQQPDGSWLYQGGGGWTAGATALSVFALVHAGVDPNDPAIQKGVAYILQQQQEQNRTYIVALTVIALASVDPVKYRLYIERGAKWLLEAQFPTGQWTYRKERSAGQQRDAFWAARGDNSNTQFAVLALREAARAGVSIGKSRWSKINAFYRRAQMRDGGWGYQAAGRQSYGSMTAAGVCGLAISSRVRQNCSSQCGHRKRDKNLEKGIRWLADRFSVTENPAAGNRHYYYYMYALERVGMLAGRRTIGGRDWYREGAAQLVQRQKLDGSWGSGVADICFALLFFGKGGAPLVVNKLKWGSGWNKDPNDMANLTKFYSKAIENPVGWEAVDLNAPLSDWLRAPILYFNGHDLPKKPFTDEIVKKLRNYVDQGGFIFAEACCGRSAFDKGFRGLVKRMCPDDELVKLEPNHPIYSMRYRLTGEVPELWGLNTGCRLSFVYSPTDLSCKGEMERWGNAAFKLGVNIISYATGDEPLRGKLDRVVIGEKGEMPKPPPRGAFVIAQVDHGSDWNTDPLSMTKLMLHLREKAGFDVGNRKKVVMLSDPDLFDYPVLYMTSHGRIRLSKENIDRLRTYLERGGFLFSDACCGKSAYDASFRDLVKQLFPEQPLERLPAAHPIFSIGGKIGAVKYKPKVLEEEPDKSRAELEGVTIDGRTCLVYSKYDITCAIHGHPCPGCRGVVKKDALRLATNIVLYAMTY